MSDNVRSWLAVALGFFAGCAFDSVGLAIGFCAAAIIALRIVFPGSEG